jgi:type VI secretion system protein ImpH
LKAVPTLTQNFVGLHGPSGILPSHVTQAVCIEGRDNALTQVLDFFNDRLADAFWRVSEVSRTPLLLERRLLSLDSDEQPDPVSGALLGLSGEPADRTHKSRWDHYRDDLARFFAVHWRRRPIGLTALQSMLRSILRLGVRILPFEPIWCEVEPNSRFRLGRNISVGRRVLGRRARQAQWTVLVQIGPVNYRTFRRFLPQRFWLLALGRLLRHTLGPSSDYVVQPILQASEVPRWRLGTRSQCAGNPAAPALLGRSTFLGKYDVSRGDFCGLKLRSSTVERPVKRSRSVCRPTRV